MKTLTLDRNAGLREELLLLGIKPGEHASQKKQSR
jgi:hypothetical protein